MPRREATKRHQGEGSIYQRRDGRWVAQATDPNTGKQKYRYAKSDAEASRKLRALLNEIESGTLPDAGRMTVADFLQQWLETAIRPHREPKTYESYRQVCKLYLVPTLGKRRLVKLTVTQVQAAINELRMCPAINQKRQVGPDGKPLPPKTLSSRTVNYAREVLRQALNVAIKWGYIHRNVATLVDTPTTRSREIEPLPAAKARRILSALQGNAIEPVCLTILCLGLRPAEALGLRWSAVDLENGTVRIHQSLKRPKGGSWVISELKTPKSRRPLPLPEPVKRALKQQQQTQRLLRLAAGPRWESHDLVFTTSIGTPLDGTNVLHRFQDLLERAGLPRMRVYDLRHGGLSFLASLKVPLPVIMAIAGHSSPRMLEQVYLHALEDDTKDAMRRMGELFETGS